MNVTSVRFYNLCTEFKKLHKSDHLNILDFKRSRKGAKVGGAVGKFIARYEDNKIITLSGNDPVHKVMRDALPDTKGDKRKIQIVKESTYSISKKKDAIKLVKDIAKKLNINIQALKNMTITDGTTNIGGNTLVFAKYFKRVK